MARKYRKKSKRRGGLRLPDEYYRNLISKRARNVNKRGGKMSTAEWDWNFHNKQRKGKSIPYGIMSQIATFMPVVKKQVLTKQILNRLMRKGISVDGASTLARKLPIFKNSVLKDGLYPEQRLALKKRQAKERIERRGGMFLGFYDLPKEEQKRLRAFWKEHGGLKGSFLGEPLAGAHM